MRLKALLGTVLACSSLMAAADGAAECPFEPDFIIVGGGATGGVLAARLAENPCVNVLLIEAGPDHSDDPLILNGMNSLMLWDLPPDVGPNPSPSNWGFEMTQEGKRYAYPRGTGLGGSVSHHSLVDGRGAGAVYDEWAQITGDSFWSYQSLSRYFRKMENWGGPGTNRRVHGTSGWLRVQTQPVDNAYEKAIICAAQKEFGVPFRADVYDNLRDFSGMYWTEYQVREGGRRSYVATDLLLPTYERNKAKGWNNLKIVTDTLVTKVLFNGQRAMGVEAIDAPRAYQVDDAHIKSSVDGPRVTYWAKKAIILSAGAINTPQILMLSGVGPKAELEKFGIPVVDDLPGVGSNWLDHMEVNIQYEVRNPPKDPETGVVVTERTSTMIDWPSGLGKYDRRDPDLHIMFHPWYYRDFNLNKEKFGTGKYDGTYIYETMKGIDPENPTFWQGALVEVSRPEARSGTVRLRSADPTEPPILDPKLADSDFDLERIAIGIEMVRQMMTSSYLEKYDLVEILPGPEFKTREQLKDYVRRYSAFGHHVSGTAKMGREDDPMAVVNSNLQVIGTAGLYVADASIMPQIPSYNTSRPSYVIGEAFADRLLQLYGYSKPQGRKGRCCR